MADQNAKSRNISAPPAPKVFHKQPKPNVKLARIIHQTKSHEEIHLVTELLAKEIFAEYKKPARVVFTYTTKNKARSYSKHLNRLTADQRAEVLKQNLLQY